MYCPTLLVSDESLRSRLTVTRLVTVVSLVTILHGLLSHIGRICVHLRRICVTHRKSYTCTPPRGGRRLPNSCAPPNSCTIASYTACCHTYKKFTHTVDSSGETERHNSGIVDFPRRHPTVSRPRARLPTYLLLTSYGAISAAARPARRPAPRPLARSPDQPAGAPPRGRARVSVLF